MPPSIQTLATALLNRRFAGRKLSVSGLLTYSFEAGAVDDLPKFSLGYFLIVVLDDGFGCLIADLGTLDARRRLQGLGNRRSARLTVHPFNFDPGGLGSCRHTDGSERQHEREHDKSNDLFSLHSVSPDLLI